MTGERGVRMVPILSLAVIAVISAYLFVDAGTILAPGRLPGQIGPDLWPRIILGALIFLCSVKIVQLLRSSFHARDAAGGLEGDGPRGEEYEGPREKKVLVTATVMVFAFVLAIDVMGFLLGTLLFLWLFTYLGRWQRKLPLTFIAVIGTLAINYLFIKIIYLPLPKGRFFFEEITVAAYRMLGIF